MQALGAKVLLTEGEKGMKGAIDKAQQLADESNGNTLILQQFEKPANPDIHEKTTGPEIWEDTDGEIDILICGVGTGSPSLELVGTLRTLKKKYFICYC
jgi:cysteine synthase A